LRGSAARWRPASGAGRLVWFFFFLTLAPAYPDPIQSSVDKDGRPSVSPRRPEREHGVPGAVRLDVKLVLIPVTVTNPLGAPYPGLPKEAFRLFEDGIQQQVTYFATEDAPVSLGIVFDASGSMEYKIEKSRQAVAEFFKTTVPGDEFFLVEFNDAPRLLYNFTSDTGELEKALESVHPKGWTSLLDAVYFSLSKMRYAKNPHKALLIVSDGGDNNSAFSAKEVMEKALADGGPYVIAVEVPTDSEVSPWAYIHPAKNS